MPAEHDLLPDAMTDEERRAKRRYDAYFAFETMPARYICDSGDACTLIRRYTDRVEVEWADGVRSDHANWVFDQFFQPLTG